MAVAPVDGLLHRRGVVAVHRRRRSRQRRFRRSSRKIEIGTEAGVLASGSDCGCGAGGLHLDLWRWSVMMMTVTTTTPPTTTSVAAAMSGGEVRTRAWKHSPSARWIQFQLKEIRFQLKIEFHDCFGFTNRFTLPRKQAVSLPSPAFSLSDPSS